MKVYNYIRYFFFIAINWSIPLAWFTIRKEIRGEKKYGVNTTGTNDVNGLLVTPEILLHAQHYQGANYYLLEKMFNFLKDETNFHSIADFGCGKGRILAVSAYYGFKKIIGVEISNLLVAEAKRNIVAIQDKYPDTIFEIIEGNAIDYKIENDCNIFFFFNPFDETIMIRVLKNILNSLKEYDREIFIGYINPVHKEVFLSAGFIEVFHEQKFEYIECSILIYAPYEEFEEEYHEGDEDHDKEGEDE